MAGSALLSFYNERKLDILRIAESEAGITSNSLADLMDSKAASMALMRYHRMGLLSRSRDGGEYVYVITERGLERLEYLEETMEVESEEEGDEEMDDEDEEGD